MPLGLVQAVLNADTARCQPSSARWPSIDSGPIRCCERRMTRRRTNSRQKLHASLALLPVDPRQVEYLYGRLLDAEPHEVPVIRDALAPHKDELLDKLWAVVETPEKGKESQRLRAAAALAKYDPESEQWDKVRVDWWSNDLVAENPCSWATGSRRFVRCKDKLLAPLSEIYRDTNRPGQRNASLATNILADYAADQPQVLADLLMDADEKQFAVIYPKFKDQGEQGLPVLTGEIDKKLPPDLPSSDENREKLAKRQANAAVALLQDEPAGEGLAAAEAQPRSEGAELSDPSPESAGCGRQGHRQASGRGAGHHDSPGVAPEFGGVSARRIFRRRIARPLLPKLQEIYRTDADPGLHAAAEWLLRQWKQEAWLKQVNEEWAKDKEQREKRLDGIKQLLTKDKEKTPPQWYVNGQGQTMVVIPGPVEFLMGSPPTEAGRQDNETSTQEADRRTFALAAKSVTVEQYRQFDEGLPTS